MITLFHKGAEAIAIGAGRRAGGVSRPQYQKTLKTKNL